MTKVEQFKSVAAAALALAGAAGDAMAPRIAGARRPASRRGSSSSPPRPGQGASAAPRSQPSWRLTMRPRPSPPTAASEASACRSISFSPSAAARPSSRAGARSSNPSAALFAQIQQRYGVPPGPLLAIWGMETAFGSQRGNQNVLSAVATLAYDCRRSGLFHRPALRRADADRSRHPGAGLARRDARRGRAHAIPAEEHPELRHRRQPRQFEHGADLDGEFPQGPWLERRRRIPAGPNEFRRHPGLECRLRLSAGDRASSANRSTGAERNRLLRCDGRQNTPSVLSRRGSSPSAAGETGRSSDRCLSTKNRDDLDVSIGQPQFGSGYAATNRAFVLLRAVSLS